MNHVAVDLLSGHMLVCAQAHTYKQTWEKQIHGHMSLHLFSFLNNFFKDTLTGCFLNCHGTCNPSNVVLCFYLWPPHLTSPFCSWTLAWLLSYCLQVPPTSSFLNWAAESFAGGSYASSCLFSLTVLLSLLLNQASRAFFFFFFRSKEKGSVSRKKPKLQDP